MDAPFSCQITVEISSGPLMPSEPAWLEALVWLHGASFGKRGAAAATVVETVNAEQRVRQVQVEPGLVRELWGHLTAAGLPGRKPRLEGVPVTSGFWTHLAVHAALMSDERGETADAAFSVDTTYEGADAPALERFMALLFDRLQLKAARPRRVPPE